jgi:hypothetical protein
MNIPLGRMTPAAVAACARQVAPTVLYPYHFDQNYAARVANPSAREQPLPDGLTVPQTLAALVDAMRGSGVDVRVRDWYPKRF